MSTIPSSIFHRVSSFARIIDLKTIGDYWSQYVLTQRGPCEIVLEGLFFVSFSPDSSSTVLISKMFDIITGEPVGVVSDIISIAVKLYESPNPQILQKHDAKIIIFDILNRPSWLRRRQTYLMDDRFSPPRVGSAAARVRTDYISSSDDGGIIKSRRAANNTGRGRKKTKKKTITRHDIIKQHF